MKKVKTTYEQAVKDYHNYYGECPTVNQIDNLYYEYGKNWRQYSSFIDWLNYFVA